MGIILGGFVCILMSLFAFNYNDKILANDNIVVPTVSSNKPDIKLGTLMYFGRLQGYYVGDDGDNILILNMGAMSSEGPTYATAMDGSIQSDFLVKAGEIGNTKGSAKMPSLQDLKEIVSADGKRLEYIPADKRRFWLDTQVASNRMRFVGPNNELDLEVKLNEYVPAKDNVCQDPKVVTSQHYGALPITDETSGGEEISYISSAKYNLESSGYSVAKYSGTRYTGYNCTGTTAAVANVSTTSGTSKTFAYNRSGVNAKEVFSADKSVFYAAAFVPTNGFGWMPKKAGDSKTVKYTSGTCVNTSYDDDKLSITGQTGYKSFKPKTSFSVTVKLSSITDAIYSKTTCPAVTNKAGTAARRSLYKFPKKNILFYTSKQITFPISQVFSENMPHNEINDNGTFLNFYEEKMRISLKQGSPGVSGTTYTVRMPKDGNTVINIPVSASGPRENKRIVGAYAIDIDGKQVYANIGNLGEGAEGTVTLDYRNLLPEGAKSFKVKLQLIDTGLLRSTYFGKETEITINLKEEQTIAFNSDENKASIEYGAENPLIIKAHYVGDVSKQANTDIKFNVPNAWLGKYRINKQSYDPETGIATAEIVALTGNENAVPLEISKAGDTSYYDATVQTMNIALKQKKVTIHPEIIRGKAVEDQMPVIGAVADGILSTDAIPAVLVPNLVKENEAYENHPAPNGIIEYPGKWKLLYPDDIDTKLDAAFKNKYDYTLLDYDDDTSYVFEVLPNGVRDSWLIVNPAPNANKWNNTPVTIEPSAEARAWGYHTIAQVIDGEQQSFTRKVTIGDETAGIVPIVVLKNSDGITDEKPIRNVKIDLTKPKIEASIPKGWQSTSMEIEVNILDTLSGVASFDLTLNGDPIACSNYGDGIYGCTLTDNGAYTFTATDRAGNVTTMKKTINNIDNTQATISAQLQPLSDDGLIQPIEVTRNPGPSGVKSINVYFMADGESEYGEPIALSAYTDPLIYNAPLTGTYKFVMETGSGVKVEDIVEVTGIVQPNPVIAIQAASSQDPSKQYVDGTWTKDDVVVNLSNMNAVFKDPVKFQYKKTNGDTWLDVENGQITFTTETFTQDEYVFQAVSTVSNDVVSAPVVFNVKIDKTKPATPIIDQEEKLKEDGNFFGSVTLNGILTPKETKLKQSLYYSLDGNITWSSLGSDTSYTFENLGDYQISFKSVDEVGNESDPTEVYQVHVLDKLAQKIVFDTDNPTDATYGGSTVTIKAHLDQDVKQQSSEPILFSITENDKANILQQSYNSDGTASAVIQILNGDQYVDILIDKAGDDSYHSAIQQTYTLTLYKAPLTITPQIISGKTVGDVLPAMMSNGTGLVNRDSVPSTLAPHLEAMDGSPATPDANGDGEIDQAGTWKLVYPDDVTSLDPEFAKKYDITAIGYDENTAPQYIFSVVQDGIKDTDLIVTAPTKGDWNNGPVKVELSDHAKANGYTLLEYLKDGVVDQYGADITFHDDHTGFMPTFVVKKDASDAGILKTVRLIRIDQTIPEVTYEIIDGEKWSTQAKQVNVKTSDLTSGMELLEVNDSDGNPISNATIPLFTFMANKNGTYHVLAQDHAGNIEELDILVEHIDDVAPILQAQTQPVSESKDYQDIDVTYTIGASGIKEFAVYYKAADEEAFPLTPLAQFDGSETAFTYRANQSGDYRFVLINNAGVRVTADVSVTEVVQAKPVIALQANLETVAQTPYQSGKWVNEDIRITLSNTNTSISDPITYQYRKGTDGTWTDLESNTFLIEEAMWSSNTYEFRGACNDQVGDAQTILVNIDKVRPEKPLIEDSDTFDEAVFAIPYTIKGSVAEKESKISQSIYVSSDQGTTWTEMVSNQYVFQQANTYELIFKTIDEAGNESIPTSKMHLTLNDGTPQITIKLNNDPLKDILHNLTFGYLFKERVNVELDVNWYGMENGTISYIVDPSNTPTTPTNEDTRWTTGDSFHIDPDQKVMIYAKAVNKDGKVARASSGYYVVADQTPPIITFKHDYTSWTNSTALTVEIKDSLTGVKSDQVKVELEKQGNITARYADGILSLSALPEGSYALSVSAIDGAGNTGTNSTTVKIDVTPPVITGVKNQATYKQYYLPRFVKVSDALSKLKTAVYQKNKGSDIDLSKGEVKIKGEGTYTIQAEDHAGNQISLVFSIVKLPDIDTEIDGTDESKDIIDQVEKEYEEVKDKLDPTEKEDIEDWIHDANEKWENSRVKVVYTEDKKAKVEGTDQVTFDPETLLVVEEIPEETLPLLPRRAIESYNVYLKKGNSVIQPDGTVKVYLPYSEAEEAILYEIDDADQVIVKNGKKEGEYITFKTDQLLRYAISNLAQKEDPDYQPDPNPDKDPDHKPDKDPDNKPDEGSDPTPTPDDPSSEEKPKPNPDDGKEPDPSKDPTPAPVPSPDSKPGVNTDSDQDGIPDVNVDINCDEQADINIDTNNDGKPDINIDTNGDGKPNYNVDLNGDQIPDLNIGPVAWKTDKCSTNECGKKYCTSTYYKPYLNIDTDGDMRPDVNLDIDNDGLPELNVDANGDLIPDVNIDSTGDKQANINIDLDGDGIADLNLVRLSKWIPELDVDKDGFKYDTMTGLKADANIDSDGDGIPDQNIVDNTNNQYILSGKGQVQALPKQVEGANTGDETNWLQWWISFIISASMFVFCMYQRRKRKLTL